MNIPFSQQSGTANIGGNKYKTYSYNRIEIIFKSEDGKELIENIPVKVLKPTSSKIEELEEWDRFPNLLGLDFLKQGWKFFCDIHNDNIYFEK